MPKLSAGLLMYRFRDEKLEVFLVHPGGPYWAKKDMRGKGTVKVFAFPKVLTFFL